jgi:hypothetical protein
VTHNSDGERTRPYTGPPASPAHWPGAQPPTGVPPQPMWAPPTTGGWGHQPAAPSPPPARGKTLRWVVGGLVVVAVIAAAVGIRITMYDEPTHAASGEPSPSADAGAGAPSSTAAAPSGSEGTSPDGGVSSARLTEFLPSASTLASLLIVGDLIQITDSDSLYTTATDRSARLRRRDQRRTAGRL